MTKTNVISIIILISASYTTGAAAQCLKDTDCKGDRICIDGSCEDPQPSPTGAAVATTPPAARPNTPAEEVPTPEVAEAPVAESAVIEQAPPIEPSEPSVIEATDPQRELPPPIANMDEIQSIRSKRRAGKALLFSGIGLMSLGLIFQAGWALEECWEEHQTEKCELTSLGSTLVIGGFIMLGLGTASTITGAIMAGKAKRELESVAKLDVAPFVMTGQRGGGLSARLIF